MSNSTISDVVRIDGQFYDTKKLATIHPGGELIVLLSNQQDVTALFTSSHRRSFPHSKYASYQVPREKIDAKVLETKFQHEQKQDFQLYLEICARVQPIIAETRGFAPWWYFLKVLAIFALVFYLDYLAWFGQRTYALTALQSFGMALIGLNIQHDANHGAVSPNFWVNRILGFGQDIIGGSSLSWMYHHNTIHHVHCNDVNRDEDLNIPLLRLMNKIPWNVSHTMQQFYFLLLEGVFGLVHSVTSLIWAWKKPEEHMKLVGHHWTIGRAFSLVLPLRLIAMAVGGLTLSEIAIHTMLLYCIGGAYLAFFFLISHNFEGVRKEGVDSYTDCFVRNQAETSSNVGGFWLAHINGGLNFQIEHHLFPRVHHSYYYLLSPVVRQVCEREKIRYTHFATPWDNFVSTFQHLARLGAKPKSE